MRSKTRETKEADPAKQKCVPEDHTRTQSCNTNGCPIDGYFTEWAGWTPSDSECGSICTKPNQKPLQTRARFCNEPENGGNPCPSSQPTSEKRNCLTSKPCPVDCEWKQWGKWSDCTKSCGPGTKKRGRSKKVFNEDTTDCRVGPCHGGLECEGAIEETSDCNIKRCPDCSWGKWSEYGSCPAKCTGAKQSRSRKQTQPPTAEFLGLSLKCDGSEVQESNCDGRNAIVKDTGYARGLIDDACKKDPGSTCFAKVRLSNHIAILPLLFPGV